MNRNPNQPQQGNKDKQTGAGKTDQAQKPGQMQQQTDKSKQHDGAGLGGKQQADGRGTARDGTN